MQYMFSIGKRRETPIVSFNCYNSYWKTAKQNMPKFKRSCNNPFHEKWTKNEGRAFVNLAERGLLNLSKLLDGFIEAELGKSSSGCKISLHYVSSRMF